MVGLKGGFIWHELRTRDLAGAERFYRDVVGWAASAMPIRHFTSFQAGSVSVAAAIEVSDDAPFRTGWVGYLGVPDVDATLDRIVGLGGAALEAAKNVEGVGRVAVVSDAQGAVIGLITLAPNELRGQQEPSASGHFGWHELYTEDPAAAMSFYAEAFGWEPGPTFNMGPAGRYHVVAVDGVPIGGIMGRPPAISSALWSPFVQSADIEAVEPKIQANGGTVIDGLREVPGGDWTVKCADDQGAIFAMSGRKPS